MKPTVKSRPQPGVHFDTLADPTRRRLLIYLATDATGEELPLTITELDDLMDTTDSFVRLYHEHLPKLEDRGYILWDEENDLVTRGPHFREMEPLLTLIAEHDHELPYDL